MNMTVNKQTRILFICTLVGMGLVLLTHFVRPLLVDPRTWVGFVFGVLPNFGAALGLPGVFSVVINGYYKSRELEISPSNLIILSLFISEVGLFGWELLQYFFWKYSIDPADLVVTLLGGSIVLGLGLWSGRAVSSN